MRGTTKNQKLKKTAKLDIKGSLVLVTYSSGILSWSQLYRRLHRLFDLSATQQGHLIAIIRKVVKKLDIEYLVE